MTTQVETAAVQRSVCTVCHHTATRPRDPWDNQFRCAEGCRCTMQGCCPGKSARQEVQPAPTVTVHIADLGADLADSLVGRIRRQPGGAGAFA